MNFRRYFDNFVIRFFGLKVLSIQLDITNSCNLNCAHCYHSNHLNHGALTLNDWNQVLDSYNELLTTIRARPNIALCGGEPFSSPHLYPLINSIRTRWPNTFIHIATNGTMIDRHVCRLKGLPLFFQISLESCNKDIHDKIRGTGAFDRSMRGIELLRQHAFDVHLEVVLSERSAAEIPNMFEFARGLGVQSLNYTRAMPFGAGSKHYSSIDTPLEGLALKDAFSDIIKNSRRTGVPTNTNKPLFCLVEKGLGSSGNPGVQGLVIAYDGKIKASSRAPIVLDHVKMISLKEYYFKNEMLQKLRAGEINVCNKCPHFFSCGGDRNYAFATTGDFLGFDSGCWFVQTDKGVNKCL